MKIQNYIHAIAQKLTPLGVGLIASVITLVFFLTALSEQPEWLYSFYQLSQHGRAVEAIVTSKRPEDHNTCSFKYSINSKQYTSSDQGCSYAEGQFITITYLPSDPSVATSAAPLQELLILAFGLLLASVVMGVGTAKAFSQYKKKKP